MSGPNNLQAASPLQIPGVEYTVEFDYFLYFDLWTESLLEMVP
jgi:hypothetical protein